MKVKSFKAILLLLNVIVVFFYVYSVPLKGLPGGIGSRILFTLFGILLFAIFLIKRFILDKFKVEYSLLLIFAAIISMAIISLLSNVCNATTDLSLFKYAGSFIYMMLAGYFVMSVLRLTHNEITFKILSTYLIVAGLVQVLLSLAMFLSPPLHDLMYAIQSVNELTEERLGAITSFRLVGFGSTFFGSGIVHGYMLILLATLIRLPGNSRSLIFAYTIAFILLLSLGSMMARTTLLGAILGLVILLWPVATSRMTIPKNILRFAASLVGVIIILSLSFFLLPAASKELLSNAWQFGFELFINLSNNESIRSDSTDELKNMFIWPHNISTYLIGDGRFVNPKDPSRYYMSTDVGYLRLLYGFGLVGTCIYLIVQLLPVVFSIIHNKRNTIVVRFFITSFVFLLLLNVKGFTDLFSLNILFYYIIFFKYTNKLVIKHTING